jgi:hypothetical protein
MVCGEPDYKGFLLKTKLTYTIFLDLYILQMVIVTKSGTSEERTISNTITNLRMSQKC